MEFAARQFVRRVLLSHLALLLVVLIAVGLAANFLYTGARTQVIQQAEQTQMLLARQTATGIENYYESVTNVLNLLQPNDNEPSTQPARRPPPGGRLPPPQQQARRHNLESSFLAGAFNRLATAVWEQINTKCSMMFIVDPLDEMSIVRVIGHKQDAEQQAAAQQVVGQAGDWLTEMSQVRTKAISPFYPEINGGAHLVVVPMRGPNALLMVAVVPVSSVERDLLAAVNRSASTGAMLVDDGGTFVSSSIPGVRGKKVKDLSDPRLRAQAELQMQVGKSITRTFDDPEKIGDVQLKPAMSTIQAIEMPRDKKWFVIISSSLDEVDNIITPIFHDAMAWAIVVMIAVMAILASTATQVIRTRLRLERAQMEIINKELTEAREIQLKWLPNQPCDLDGIDIAAMNMPASHISGDFYNWFPLPDGRIAITIGDVTGHGMSAAFMMATTQLLVRTNLPRYCDPGPCLEEVNRQLCTQVFNGQFVTMLILVLDLENGTIDIASGGHPPPLLCNNGYTRPLPIDPALVLGVDDSVSYPTERVKLMPGAALLLYTDGVPDTVAPSGERFSDEKLITAVHGQFESADQMLQTVIRSIESFRTGRDLSDDLTLVAVQLSADFVPGPAPRPEAVVHGT